MYFCKNCGAQLEDEALFCASCGAKREAEEMEVPVMEQTVTMGETVAVENGRTGFGALFGGACKHVMFLVAAILTSTFVLFSFFAKIVDFNIIGVLEMMVTGGLVVTGIWLMYVAGLKRKPNASYTTSLKLIRIFWLIQLIWTGITLFFGLIGCFFGLAGSTLGLGRILGIFGYDYYYYFSESKLILEMFKLLITGAATIVYIIFSFQMIKDLSGNLESDILKPVASGKKWAIMVFIYVGIHFIINLVSRMSEGYLFLELINSGALVLYGVQMLLLNSKIAADR